MIVPPARIGMLGGGQLGRYALIEARLMGYESVVVDPDADAPAGRVADVHLVDAYDSTEALELLAATCAVVTTEFENVPAAALERLAVRLPVAPAPSIVAIAQDRAAEKSFLRERGFAVVPFALVASEVDVGSAFGGDGLVGPAILKTARLGYDGKGQVTVAGPGALRSAWDSLGRVPCILEQRMPLDVELSVVVARSTTGATAAYPVAENAHAGGILDVTVVPARVPSTVAAEAERVGRDVAAALDYVGVLGVELFVSDGRILVNELAPRPHNSGHWTLDAAVTNQFAQQVRAVCGLALGSTALTAPAVAMANLLGEGWTHGEPDWSHVLTVPDARLHLYGKRDARPGRKMGHLTLTAADADTAEARARVLRDAAFGTP